MNNVIAVNNAHACDLVSCAMNELILTTNHANLAYNYVIMQ